jgi:hypothetical protein
MCLNSPLSKNAYKYTGFTRAFDAFMSLAIEQNLKLDSFKLHPMEDLL